MKASLNGCVQFSTSDGWVDEIDLSDIGWRLPVDRPAKLLYDRLEGDIAHKFYDRGEDGLPHDWIKLMRANMSLILEQFTAARMLEDYYVKLYAPAANPA
jgi:starch phosphorylase